MSCGSTNQNSTPETQMPIKPDGACAFLFSNWPQEVWWEWVLAAARFWRRCELEFEKHTSIKYNNKLCSYFFGQVTGPNSVVGFTRYFHLSPHRRRNLATAKDHTHQFPVAKMKTLER
ncbi:unnamed protein product, partial [Pylaiella littoralis]